MTTNTHGGRRPNAGRPAQSRGRLIRVLIRIYPDQREWLVGQGNVAAAVRAAVDEKIQRDSKNTPTMPVTNSTTINAGLPG